MNAVEHELSRVGVKWKLRMFLEHFGLAADIITLLVLLTGVAIDHGLITTTATANIIVALLAGGGLLALAIIFILAISWISNRQKLAELVEKAHPGLADRLNTLVYLERFRITSYTKHFWFHRRIATQASDTLSGQGSGTPVSWARAITVNSIFIVLLIMTCAFFEARHPWQTLQQREETARETQPNKLDNSMNLALPDMSAIEEKRDWGDIRITDPARDMKITKVDAVPLQIEAAASAPITYGAWLSSVNGDTEVPHVLPAPREPKYALYQPIIYADEFGLRDWDVMTYFAQAGTASSNTFGSEVYFLEVRPFREDILKMPGGESGAGYQVISEITGLIARQQEIIRQTHRSIQSPAATEKLQAQDHGKLADAENDMSVSAGHLYADIAVKMENKPVGAALDQLAKVGDTLLAASDSLRANAMTPGFEKERAALRQLIDTRKLVQKTLSDHPEDFKDQPDTGPDIVASDRDKLGEMAEFQNEDKAANDFMDNLLKRQQSIATNAAMAGNKTQPTNAALQRDLHRELQQFSSQHPRVFNTASNELARAFDAMDRSAKSLDRRAASNRKEPGIAMQTTTTLAQTVRENTTSHQLSDAYRLKKLLDQQSGQLKHIEEKPDEPSQDSLGKTASQAKETTRQLKQFSSQHTGSDLIGPELAASLSDSRKQALDQTLDKLARAQTPQDRKDLASQAGAGLRQILDAFEKSQPQALRQALSQDALAPDNNRERGMDQLRSMMARLQGNRQPSDQELMQMAREARLAFEEDLKQHPDEATKKLLMILDKEIKEEGHKIDLAGLKKLMAELENFSTEVKDTISNTNETAVTTPNSDKTPPAYRRRIETYFRKLSESKQP
jgi:hypothetical protein